MQSEHQGKKFEIYTYMHTQRLHSHGASDLFGYGRGQREISEDNNQINMYQDVINV